METNDEHFMADRASLEALIRKLPARQREVYESYLARSLEAAFPGRVFVIYTLRDELPINLELVTMGQLTMDYSEGPVVTLSSDDKEVEVGMVPVKWEGREVFFHVPQEFVFKWKGKQVSGDIEFAPQYAVLIKTRTREHVQVDGHTYCVTLNKFRERFPKVPVRY